MFLKEKKKQTNKNAKRHQETFGSDGYGGRREMKLEMGKEEKKKTRTRIDISTRLFYHSCDLYLSALFL